VGRIQPGVLDVQLVVRHAALLQLLADGMAWAACALSQASGQEKPQVTSAL
jgi:hypothetical protein